MIHGLDRLTASASPLTRAEATAARQTAILMKDARDRATEILSGGYRPRGSALTEYDVAFARSKKAALIAEVDALERDLERWIGSGVADAAELARADVSKIAKEPLKLDRGVVAMSRELSSDHVAAGISKMRQTVRSSVTAATAGRISVAELNRLVRAAIGGAETIDRFQRSARLDVNQGYQQQRAAMDEQLAALGRDLIKVWWTQEDERVRDSHASIHGQERELRSLFNVGEGATAETAPRSKRGSKANGPLDPSLPAEELYNCRCYVVYRRRKDARNSYISKTPKTGKRSKASEEEPMVVRVLGGLVERLSAAGFNPYQVRDGYGKWSETGAEGPAKLGADGRDVRLPAKGTHIRKTWKGVEYVAWEDDGGAFYYRPKGGELIGPFPSLSAAATAIRGHKTNGFLFFGLGEGDKRVKPGDGVKAVDPKPVAPEPEKPKPIDWKNGNFTEKEALQAKLDALPPIGHGTAEQRLERSTLRMRLAGAKQVLLPPKTPPGAAESAANGFEEVQRQGIDLSQVSIHGWKRGWKTVVAPRGYGTGAYGWASISRRVVTINFSITPETHVAETMIHELGHVLHFEGIKELAAANTAAFESPIGSYFKQERSMWKWGFEHRTKLGIEFNGTFKGRPKGVWKVEPLPGVSNYSATNPLEFVAENFVRLVRKHTLPPGFLDVYRDLKGRVP